MKVKSFFMGVLAFASLTTASAQQADSTQAQDDSLVQAAYCIDGKFYSKEMPMNWSASLMQSYGSLKLADGSMVPSITLRKGAALPGECAKFEIPRQRVKQLKQLDELLAANRLMKERMYPEGGDKYTELKVGKKLPGAFAEFDIDGNPWTEEMLKRHKVVVNCWFSGCGPCLREMPELSEWKKQFPDVLFLSANFEKADKVKKITAQRGFTWNHIYDDKYFVKFVGTGGFPLFIILDEKGIVRYFTNGTSEEKRSEIFKIIKSL